MTFNLVKQLHRLPLNNNKIDIYRYMYTKYLTITNLSKMRNKTGTEIPNRTESFLITAIRDYSRQRK